MSVLIINVIDLVLASEAVPSSHDLQHGLTLLRKLPSRDTPCVHTDSAGNTALCRSAHTHATQHEMHSTIATASRLHTRALETALIRETVDHHATFLHYGGTLSIPFEMAEATRCNDALRHHSAPRRCHALHA